MDPPTQELFLPPRVISEVGCCFPLHYTDVDRLSPQFKFGLMLLAQKLEIRTISYSYYLPIVWSLPRLTTSNNWRCLFVREVAGTLAPPSHCLLASSGHNLWTIARNLD